MSSNSRLTIATHILAWMALVETGRADPVTSERIARSVNTNPVVIRRLLGALARKGLVKSHRGANAGWTLATSADAITLSDIYRAVEDGSLFAMHASPPNQACPVGRGIQPVLTQVYDALDAVLQKQLAEVTIKDILDRILAKDR